MSCEYSVPSTDGRQAACMRIQVLKEIKDRFGDGFTVRELKTLICDPDDGTARQDCHAYTDLQAHGRNSRYCK
jgi:hypothetical protein